MNEEIKEIMTLLNELKPDTFKDVQIIQEIKCKLFEITDKENPTK